MKFPSKIILCEVGPRDGLQNEKIVLSAEKKASLIEKMVEAGARVIEIGSFVHPKAVPAMADTDMVAKLVRKREGVDYRALVLNKKGVERAIDAGVTKVKLTVSASPTHSQQNSNALPEEIVRGFAECVSFARERGVVLSSAIATAFGYYTEGVIGLDKTIPLVDAFVSFGITEISMSDSTGLANPKQVFNYMSELKGKYPDVTWTFHAHNTRGLAMANICAAMQAGVCNFDASFAGIGGCPFAPGASGNIATEDVVNMAHEMGIETGFDLAKVIEVAREVRELFGHAESAMLRLPA